MAAIVTGVFVVPTRRDILTALERLPKGFVQGATVTPGSGTNFDVHVQMASGQVFLAVIPYATFVKHNKNIGKIARMKTKFPADGMFSSIPHPQKATRLTEWVAEALDHANRINLMQRAVLDMLGVYNYAALPMFDNLYRATATVVNAEPPVVEATVIGAAAEAEFTPVASPTAPPPPYEGAPPPYDPSTAPPSNAPPPYPQVTKELVVELESLDGGYERNLVLGALLQSNGSKDGTIEVLRASKSK